jgi:hypothetical protein
MSRRSAALARCLGIGLSLVAFGRWAEADAEHELLAQAIRDKHPPIDWKRIEEGARANASEMTEAELDHDIEVVGRMLKRARDKWRAVQLRRRTNALVESTVVYKWAHDALSWAGTVKEKEDRLADIRKREDEEFWKRFGRPYYSIFRKDKTDLEYEDKWYMSGRGKAYRDEEKAVHAWFQGEIKARVKEQSGTTPVSVLLDAMQEEAIQEIAGLNRALKLYADARKRKRGEAVEDEAAKRADEEAERHRSELRLAPVRTEYETTTGEPVETFFQVWKGAAPYTARATAQGAVERPLVLDLAQGGEFVVPFTFRKPGTFQATVTVWDSQAYEKSAVVTVTVTGDPIPDEKPPAKDPGTTGSKPGDPAAGGGGVATAPVQGTFQALLWGGTAGLNRWDWINEFRAAPAPLTLTIAPDGTLSAKVRYVLPPEEMKPYVASEGATPMENRFWKTSFDLSGRVDWASGKVSISIANGHDERGYEGDAPKLDDKGKKVGTSGHWRDWTKVDYSSELEGWTVPGPQAAEWLSRFPKSPEILQQLASASLEDLGLPHVVIGTGDALSFRDRGFFGMSDLTSAPPPDGTTPRRRKFGLYLQHTGYDGMNEKEEDVTKKEQARADAEAKGRQGGWYLKLLGVAPADAGTTATPAAEPKDDDVLAFGLWPVKPITLPAGANMSARAMGVFGKDVNAAVDLSEKATWTASPGLVLLKGGSFSAPTPGTYTLTATLATPGGPMTSTIQVVVTK